jgi:hypothetical protein
MGESEASKGMAEPFQISLPVMLVRRERAVASRCYQPRGGGGSLHVTHDRIGRSDR